MSRENTCYLEEKIQNANSSIRASMFLSMIGTFTLAASLLALLVNLDLYLKGVFSLFDSKTAIVGFGIVGGMAASAGGLIGAYYYSKEKKELVNQYGSIDA